MMNDGCTHSKSFHPFFFFRSKYSRFHFFWWKMLYYIVDFQVGKTRDEDKIVSCELTISLSSSIAREVLPSLLAWWSANSIKRLSRIDHYTKLQRESKLSAKLFPRCFLSSPTPSIYSLRNWNCRLACGLVSCRPNNCTFQAAVSAIFGTFVCSLPECARNCNFSPV